MPRRRGGLVVDDAGERGAVGVVEADEVAADRRGLEVGVAKPAQGLDLGDPGGAVGGGGEEAEALDLLELLGVGGDRGGGERAAVAALVLVGDADLVGVVAPQLLDVEGRGLAGAAGLDDGEGREVGGAERCRSVSGASPVRRWTPSWPTSNSGSSWAGIV
jgi:hypothetical protein